MGDLLRSFFVNSSSPYPEIFGGGLGLVGVSGFFYVVARLGAEARKEGYPQMPSRTAGMLEASTVFWRPTLVLGILLVTVGLVGSVITR